jgi:hypothetical protein
MAWKLEGTYFENCNCDWVCPCTVTSFASPATGDRCQVILNYHVGRGDIDGVDVGGRSVSLVVDSPKKMLDGGWRVGLIIDDKASKEQADKLTGVFAGQAGGPMANLAPLIGELLGIERLPIEYSDHGKRHKIRIGDAVAIEIEDFAAQEGGETTKVTGVAHPSGSTITIARPIDSKIKAFGMEFKNAGKSAFSAPFSWAG